ncbi:MAG: amidohydrolase, partial [Halothiobacillus sp.]|nr:amidohydrolase [Halothiobacillus sp.]
SQPELCRDPVLAAAAITLNLQQIVARRLPPQTAAVVSVTSIDAPSGITVIPESARLAGSVRIGDTQTRALIGRLIEDIAESTARSYGVEAKITFTPRYQATVNHPEPALHYRGALTSVLGADWCASELPVPIMASEDFSYYLEAIPGAFALIGANDGTGHHEPCHSPLYDFNDQLIDPVGRVLASLIGVSPP